VKSNIHVDAELLAAWSEGSLPEDQATQVEQSNVGEQSTYRVAFHPFGWVGRLILRMGGAWA